ncbi:MAG: beta-galactosidase [Lentisphaeria bacterium]|jgi:hypothetical protein
MSLAKFDLNVAATPVVRGQLRMGGANPCGERLGINSQWLEWNGKPWLPVMGEFHSSRYPHAYWEEEILKIKAGGVTILACYLFWLHHEEDEGVFDFSGDRDIRRFLELCARHGLPVVLRIGPFCHGEARNGGLPDWLYGQPFEARSDDPRYLCYVERYYREIGRQVQGLLFKDGGPVIGIQCENEFMDSAAPWETTQNPAMEYTPKGTGGNGHMRTLKRLAIEAGLEAPLWTATGWGKSPVEAAEFLPLFGGYAFYAWLDDPSQQGPSPNYVFLARHGRESAKFDTAGVPVACCELGGGMQPFYRNRPVVPACSVEAMHVTYLGSGTNLVGYYMYHGGSNPVGKHAYFNEHRCPRISYDFQAPVREFGQLSEAYRRLKRQFLFLEEWGGELAPMQTVLAQGLAKVEPADSEALRCAVRVAADGRRGFLFLNNYQDHAELRDQEGVRVELELGGGGGTLRLPAAGGFTLRKDACAIFPFNLPLGGGLELRQATAQPLTRAALGEGECQVFFAIPGIPCEYAFDAAAGVRVAAGAGTLRRVGDLDVLTVEPGLESLVRVAAAGGRQAQLLTLTAEQSLNCWKVAVAGRRRLLLASADLVPCGDRLDLLPLGNQAATLWLLAGAEEAAQAALAAAGGEEGAPPPARRREGAFVRHDFTTGVPRPPLPFTVEDRGPGRRLVRVPASALAGANDLFLRIDYFGDVGQAFINGKLVHDNFCNGQPWEIGLKRFMPPGRDLELVIRIVPARPGGGGPNVQYSAMAAMEIADSGTVEIRGITLVPQYKIAVALPGA